MGGIPTARLQLASPYWAMASVSYSSAGTLVVCCLLSLSLVIFPGCVLAVCCTHSAPSRVWMIWMTLLLPEGLCKRGQVCLSVLQASFRPST